MPKTFNAQYFAEGYVYLVIQAKHLKHRHIEVWKGTLHNFMYIVFTCDLLMNIMDFSQSFGKYEVLQNKLFGRLF